MAMGLSVTADVKGSPQRRTASPSRERGVLWRLVNLAEVREHTDECPQAHRCPPSSWGGAETTAFAKTRDTEIEGTSGSRQDFRLTTETLGEFRYGQLLFRRAP